MQVRGVCHIPAVPFPAWVPLRGLARLQASCAPGQICMASPCSTSRLGTSTWRAFTNNRPYLRAPRLRFHIHRSAHTTKGRPAAGYTEPRTLREGRFITMCGPTGACTRLARRFSATLWPQSARVPLLPLPNPIGSVFGLAVSAFGIAFLSFLAILIRNEYP